LADLHTQTPREAASAAPTLTPTPETAAALALPGPLVPSAPRPPAERPAPAGDMDPARRNLRRLHVGSSEAAALFNLSPYATRLELYLRKRGELPEPDLSTYEPVRWGQVRETAVGQAVGERMGWSVRKVRRYVTHPAVAGMGCSLDFEIVNHRRGAGVLEIKTVDRLAFRDWEGGRPPIHYELQLQHQLACTRRGWGAIGVPGVVTPPSLSALDAFAAAAPAEPSRRAAPARKPPKPAEARNNGRSRDNRAAAAGGRPRKKAAAHPSRRNGRQ
jgi:hypothetical protein